MGSGDDSLVGKFWQPTRPRRKRRQTRRDRWLSRLKWYGLPVLGVLIGTWATLRFSLLAPNPPVNPDDLCEIFREHTVWYDYASDSQARWGTPIATQMAFVYYESSFRSHAQPPRTVLWGFIPWSRAFRYDNQLKSCEQEFQCWHWYQFWPFCS